MNTVPHTLDASRAADAVTDEAALASEQRLVAWLRDQGSVLIGFSGGVDSVYLACVAVDALDAERVLAVIGRSASYPAEQWETARRVAASFGIPVAEVATEELEDPRYAANPTNRCYFCKTELWSRLAPLARARGFAIVVDGTNADDLGDYRPGARAAGEHGVRSPLAELGFTKAMIRRLSRARGLPTWSQPSAPCLSSRIPYGTAVTIDRLGRVEQAERALRELGVGGDLRVRYHGDLARLELDPRALDAWLASEGRHGLRERVTAAGFDRVAVDLTGFRSGSLNVLGGVTIERRPARNEPPDAEQLERRLRALDPGHAVEARDRLAIVVPRHTNVADGYVRRERRTSAGEAARACGFTHVALEILEVLDGDAALRRA